jgi:hypothetical protein
MAHTGYYKPCKRDSICRGTGGHSPTLEKPRCTLVGTDGNVFALIGRVRAILMKHGLDEQAKEMMERITTQAGDYYQALAVMMEYVEVE